MLPFGNASVSGRTKNTNLDLKNTQQLALVGGGRSGGFVGEPISKQNNI